jgi:hypothetical protein
MITICVGGNLFPQILFGIIYFMGVVHCPMLKIKSPFPGAGLVLIQRLKIRLILTQVSPIGTDNVNL